MRFQQVFDYVEEAKPKVVLEFGTWTGMNAKKLFKMGVEKYIGFDLFEDGDDMLDELENNLKPRAPVDKVREFLDGHDVELIKGNTRDTAGAYCKGKEPFVDMVIIDGGHSQGTIRNDMMASLALIKHSGAIFLDDYYFDCPISGVGAQTALAHFNVPYTVLPVTEKAKGGYLIKMVRVNATDVPRLNLWSMSDEETWRFEAA